MSRFRFPLERAWIWRRGQMESEERSLETLLQERAKLAAGLDQLLREAEAALAHLTQQPRLDTLLLEELAVWKEWSVEEARRRRARIAAQSEKVAAQMQRVVEARRRFELLDHLRKRRAREWEEEERKRETQEMDELAVLRWRIRNGDAFRENA